MEMQGFPSKVYTIMHVVGLYWSAREGIRLSSIPAGTWLCKIDYREEFGKEGGRMVDWLNSVSRSELALLGRNGVEVIKRLYSKDVVISKICRLS